MLGEEIYENDDHRYILPTQESIWECYDIDLITLGPLKCDNVLREYMEYELAEKYSKQMFKGIPCSTRLGKLAEEAGKKIKEANKLKKEALDLINKEIAVLM